MASKTYLRKHVDGNIKKFSRLKQGRKPLPIEFVKIPVTGFILPSRKQKIIEESKRIGISMSEYIEFALTFFDYDRQFSYEENCSKQ